MDGQHADIQPLVFIKGSNAGKLGELKKRDMRRAETDAKGIALLLGLTIQRIYQLENEEVIARTPSGYYNIADTIARYTYYKREESKLPLAEYTQQNGFFIEITEDTSVTAEELGELLGLSEAMINSYIKAGIFETTENTRNGIAESLALDTLKTLVNEKCGENEEAQRKLEAFLATVERADTMTPSGSKWELYAIQDSLKALCEAVGISVDEALATE